MLQMKLFGRCKLRLILISVLCTIVLGRCTRIGLHYWKESHTTGELVEDVMHAVNDLLKNLVDTPSTSTNPGADHFTPNVNPFTPTADTNNFVPPQANEELVGDNSCPFICQSGGSTSTKKDKDKKRKVKENPNTEGLLMFIGFSLRELGRVWANWRNTLAMNKIVISHVRSCSTS